MNLFDHIVNNFVIKHCHIIKSIVDIIDNIFYYRLQYFLNRYNIYYSIVNNIVYNANYNTNNIVHIDFTTPTILFTTPTIL